MSDTQRCKKFAFIVNINIPCNELRPKKKKKEKNDWIKIQDQQLFLIMTSKHTHKKAGSLKSNKKSMTTQAFVCYN